ncbi:putative cytosolic iron-sulfur protein assembly protein 1 [Cyberlindnera fabianii]|uniref:Probable cytosolic iron-sulfur protein assembly protein 1 n=1 Tax=Cyberlindnera fabianii TaxID=36022 RepID=A0A1V2LB00_CYBFA|nr:putative cytosolic iron-sulfur protein assembly protein 1 [Cyberlindnera fabianii]
MTREITSLKKIPAHSDKVWSISTHPRLPLLASVSTDKTCKIFSLDSYARLAELDDTHKRSIRSVAWKPTGNLPSLACGSFDSTISVWGKEEEDEFVEDEWSLLAVIEGHENEVKGVAWSKDGYFMASCSRDKSIWVWEADDENEEFECVSVLQEHSQDVKHVVWHPFENMLASSSYDDTIKLWKEEDDDDWACVATLKGHEGTVWCSDFEKVEMRTRLVSGSDDCTVKVWKCVDDHEHDWILESTLPQQHTRPVYSVSWSGLSGRIASIGSDGKLVVYEEGPQSDGDDDHKSKWQVVAIQELSHGVYEANCVQWATVGGKEVLITGGDDGFVNVWSIN